MKALAARRSASLALLFLGVYGGCNWMTAQRTDVGVWYYEWERLIPFWPLMIVPYLSIDAFFLVAPFLCRDRDELRVLSARIATAIVVAGICFAVFPLRFAFDRPAIDGWLGALFNGFTTLDRPYNLFPSLHITLAVILADTYARHTSGLLRIALLVWFALIGLSTVFTFQHHVVDLAGGLLLATIVHYLIRERGGSPHGATRNVRIGAYYAIGSGLAALLAAMLWPWGALLLWPALSLAIVCAAYLGLGPAVLAKANGRIPISTRILLWPYFIGQRASLSYYRRQCPAYNVVVPGVWIGRRLDEDEAGAAIAAGVTAVLDLTAEFDEVSAFRRVAYASVPTLDLTAPSADALNAAVRFVSEESRRGIVYVHCKIGYSRSAAVVGAWLLTARHARTTEEAIGFVRRVRPQAIVRPEAVAAIRQFEAVLSGSVRPVHRRPSLERALCLGHPGVGGTADLRRASMVRRRSFNPPADLLCESHEPSRFRGDLGQPAGIGARQHAPRRRARLLGRRTDPAAHRPARAARRARRQRNQRRASSGHDCVGATQRAVCRGGSRDGRVFDHLSGGYARVWRDRRTVQERSLPSVPDASRRGARAGIPREPQPDPAKG